MAVTFVKKHQSTPSTTPSAGRGHTRAKAPEISLDQPGRLRVAHLLALFGISHATLYAGIQSGRYPKRDGLDGRLPYWKTETIREFLRS